MHVLVPSRANTAVRATKILGIVRVRDTVRIVLPASIFRVQLLAVEPSVQVEQTRDLGIIRTTAAFLGKMLGNEKVGRDLGPAEKGGELGGAHGVAGLLLFANAPGGVVGEHEAKVVDVVDGHGNVFFVFRRAEVRDLRSKPMPRAKERAKRKTTEENVSI